MSSQGVLWQVPQHRELIDGGEVRGRGGDTHSVSKTPDGTSWIRKRVVTTGDPSMVAEAASWLLAKEFRVPVPPAAVYLDPADPNENSWLSSQVTAALHWDPDLADDVGNISHLGEVLALDVLVLNHDRHADNILLEPLLDGTFDMWAIDFGHALIGQPPDFTFSKDSTLRPDRPPLGGIPRSKHWARIRMRALLTASAIQQLPEAVLQRTVAEAARLGRETRGAEIAETLLYRRERIVDLTAAYCARLEMSE